MRRTLWKLLVILSVLFVSVGSTVAYLTDVEQEVNVMTLGRVEIDLIEQERNSAGTLVDFQDNHPLYPGVQKNGLVVGTDGYWMDVRNAVDKIVTVKNTGKASAYVRLWFAFEVTDDDKFFDSKIHLNRNTTDWTWSFMKATDGSGYQYLTLNGSRYVVATATYTKVLPSNATTPVSLRQVLLDSSATNDDFIKLGDKYSIFVVAQAMQTEGFDSAVEALAEGFGVPSVENHPFAGMKEEDAGNTPSDNVTYGEAKYDDVPVLVEPAADADILFTIDEGQRFEIVEFVIEENKVTYMKALCTNPQTGEIVTGYIAWENARIVQDEEDEVEIIGLGVIQNTNGVNFRKGPGTQHVSMALLKLGVTVELIEIPEVIDTQHWFKVRYNGEIGYIQAPYVKVLGEDEEPDEVVIVARGEICNTTNGVNFRVGPGTDYGFMDRLAAGVIVEIIEIPEIIDTNHWFKVRYNGTVGYIMAPYVKVLAEDDTYGDFTYTSDGTSITITGYTGTDTDVVIPSTIDGLPVTAIGNGAFRDNKTITSIDIPDGVERLCSSAIWNCSNLTNISIPDTVTTLENHAIGYCSKLTSVDIPNSLTALGAFTFVACKNLTSVTIPASVTSIGIRPFQYCDNLTAIYVDEDNPAYASYEGVLYSKDMTLLIKCPSAKSGPLAIPYGVITIQESACWDCPLLTSVILPNTVTTIEDHGLGCEDYNKRVVTIPSSVINIGYGAFDVVSARVYAGSYAHTYCIENDVAFELIDSDEAEVPIADFTYTSDGKSITITDYIGTDTDVVIPLTIEGLPVTSIGTSAFFNCPNLTSIFIPDSVTSIGSDAFYRCTNLTSIIIPNGVTEINQLTFSNCTNLSNVILPDNLTSIGGSAFASCSKLTSMAIPDNVTSIGVGAFMDCTSLTSMIIPEGVTSIGIYTFENCASLTSIIIPDSVTTIDRDAFLGCKMLTVYASAGSYAEQWCIKYSMPYDTI